MTTETGILTKTTRLHAHRVQRSRDDDRPEVRWHEHETTTDPGDRSGRHLLDDRGGHAHLDAGLGLAVRIVTEWDFTAIATMGARFDRALTLLQHATAGDLPHETRMSIYALLNECGRL